MSKLNVIGKVLLADEKQLEQIEQFLEAQKEQPLEKEETVNLMEQAKGMDSEVIFEADPAFEPGATLMVSAPDGEPIPAPVTGEGEAYELEDGRRVVVSEEGIIAEVMDAGEQEEEVPAEEEDVAMDSKPNETPLPKVIIESVVKETKFSEQEETKEEKIAKLKAELSALEGDEEESEKETKVELSEETVDTTELSIINPNPEEKPSNTGIKFQWGTGRQESAADRVMAKLANRK